MPGAAGAFEERVSATPGWEGLHFPHVIHVGFGCGFCHPVSDGRPALPDHDTCRMCHVDKLEAGTADGCGHCHPGQDGAPLSDPDDVEVVRLRPEGYEDVRFDHDRAATDLASCAGCHAEVLSRSDLEGGLLPSMADSVAGFHLLGGDDADCEACHQRLAPEVRPSGHTEAFRIHHGTDRDPIGAGQCDLCHDLDDCTTCHRVTPPPDHASHVWTKFHGREFDDIERGRCLLCHQQDTCVQCHRTQMPESHTDFWRLRAHGQRAAVDRRSCMVCHQEDRCVACHTRVSPPLPRARYHESGADCMLCHAPGSFVQAAATHGPPGQQACLDCHQLGGSKRGREVGPPMPPAPFHMDGAQDCQVCHAPSSPIRPVRRHQPYPVEVCTVCHEVGGPGLPRNPPLIPALVFHTPDADCAACHGAVPPIGPVPPHPIYPSQFCTLCHMFE